MTPHSAFVLVSSEHGMMLVNRFDWCQGPPPENRMFGVGFDVMHFGGHAMKEIDLCLGFLGLRRKYYGDGVVALDVGANVGGHTLSMARYMRGPENDKDWGKVIAFEAQKIMALALGGNIVMNNLFRNADAFNLAISDEIGVVQVPVPDYFREASFGSIEALEPEGGRQDVGQGTEYPTTIDVAAIPLDSFNYERVDFLKIDVEGMELRVLNGAKQLVERCRPVILAEWYKSDQSALYYWLVDRGYDTFSVDMSFLAVHRDDPCRSHVNIEPKPEEDR